MTPYEYMKFAAECAFRVALETTSHRKCKSHGCMRIAVHNDGRCDECHTTHLMDMKRDGEMAAAENARRRYDSEPGE